MYYSINKDRIDGPIETNTENNMKTKPRYLDTTIIEALKNILYHDYWDPARRLSLHQPMYLESIL